MPKRKTFKRRVPRVLAEKKTLKLRNLHALALFALVGLLLAVIALAESCLNEAAKEAKSEAASFSELLEGLKTR